MTIKPADIFLANSGYKLSAPYNNGLLKLHRVGTDSVVEYHTLQGFSHIVTSFVDQNEAVDFIAAESAQSSDELEGCAV